MRVFFGIMQNKRLIYGKRWAIEANCNHHHHLANQYTNKRLTLQISTAQIEWIFALPTNCIFDFEVSCTRHRQNEFGTIFLLLSLKSKPDRMHYLCDAPQILSNNHHATHNLPDFPVLDPMQHFHWFNDLKNDFHLFFSPINQRSTASMNRFFKMIDKKSFLRNTSLKIAHFFLRISVYNCCKGYVSPFHWLRLSWIFCFVCFRLKLMQFYIQSNNNHVTLSLI